MAKKKALSTLPRITITPYTRNNRLKSVKVSGKKFPAKTIINIEISFVDQLRSSKLPFLSLLVANMNFDTDSLGAFSLRYNLLYDQIFENNEYSSIVIDEFLCVEVKWGRHKVIGILKDIFKYNPYNTMNG